MGSVGVQSTGSAPSGVRPEPTRALTVLSQRHERAQRSAEQKRSPDSQRNAELGLVTPAYAPMYAASEEERRGDRDGDELAE
jgi:hypothetical protein